MTLRTKQVLAVVAGVVVAGVMLLLGLWQMASYQESTRDVSVERAAEAPTPLADAVGSDGVIQDVYGKPVTLSGSYLPQHEATVGVDGEPSRVVTALELLDGRHVAVVRGAVGDDGVPAPPVGQQDITGIFLAPDMKADDPPAAGNDLASLRVQELAQRWPSPLIGGYVTLSEADSAAQGLAEAQVVLPDAEGSPTHRGYALQWWVFAAGAIAFGIYVARGFIEDEAKEPATPAG